MKSELDKMLDEYFSLTPRKSEPEYLFIRSLKGMNKKYRAIKRLSFNDLLKH